MVDHHSRLALLLWLFRGLILWPAVMIVRADNFTLIASQDTYLYDSNPTTNYGSAGVLPIRRDAAALIQGLIQFDLSSVSGPATWASLVLTVDSGNSNSASSLEFGGYKMGQVNPHLSVQEFLNVDLQLLYSTSATAAMSTSV